MHEGFSPEQPNSDEDLPIVKITEVVESPGTAEQLESRQEIIAEAGGARAKLLGGVLAERLKGIYHAPISQKLLKAAPGIGDGFLIASVLTGKEGDQKLTKKQHALYGIAASFAVAAAVSLISGEKKLAVELGIIGDIFQHIEALPTYLQTAARAVEHVRPQLASILVAGSGFIAATKDEIMQLQYLFDDSIIKLDLSEESA